MTWRKDWWEFRPGCKSQLRLRAELSSQMDEERNDWEMVTIITIDLKIHSREVSGQTSGCAVLCKQVELQPSRAVFWQMTLPAVGRSKMDRCQTWLEKKSKNWGRNKVQKPVLCYLMCARKDISPKHCVLFSSMFVQKVGPEGLGASFPVRCISEAERHSIRPSSRSCFILYFVIMFKTVYI